MTYRLGLFVLGLMVAAVLYIAVELATSPPDEPFPSWRPAPTPTPTVVPAPRGLRTATQVTP